MAAFFKQQREDPFMKHKTIVTALALQVTLMTSGAASAQTARETLQMARRITTADIFEAADYASKKCPGVHVVEDGIGATADEEGITDEVIYSDEWRMWEARAHASVIVEYQKDPAAWCSRIWHFLGPDHPPGIKHALLTKD
jgi:hypothetical protein